MKTLGEKIKNARKELGMTQWQLANHIFVSESYIALIESNHREPSLQVLRKLSEILHITLDEFLINSSDRQVESYLIQFQNLISDRNAEEIESAIKMLQCYFDCLDKLKEK